MSAPKKSLLQELRVAFRQAGEELRKISSGNTLDAFPLRRAFKGYGRRTFLADVKAAINVALLDIPQGMAYAAVAGLPLQFGPTCSAAATLTGPVLSSSRFTVLGPTNATAFMIFSYFAAYPHLNRISLMPLLIFLVGALLVMGAFFRVADLAQYISRTVVVAYVTGASLLIMANQAANVFGITLEAEGPDGESFNLRTLPGILYQLVLSIGSLHWESVLISVVTAGIYIALRRWRPKWPALALALVFSTLIAEGLQKAGVQISTFKEAAFTWRDLLPPFPDFASSKFLADFNQLFGLSVAVAFLAMLESSTMGKTLASRNGQRVDANQDMLSLGVANLACAYLSGMPASGSLTRSALNQASGARTALAVMYNGVFCLIGALTLGPVMSHVPRAALAILIICVAASLINRRHIRVCLFATRSDGVVFLVTFLSTLMVPLHVAIFTGVGVSLILYLRKASQPSLVEYEFNPEGQLAEARQGVRRDPSISIVHVEGELFFGAAELFRSQIQRTCADPDVQIIILRLKNARHLDATSVMALEDLLRSLRADGRDLIISGAMKDVYRVLKDSCLIDVIGRQNIFLGSTTNPNLSTRNALKRAQQILGSTDAKVHIFYDPHI